MPEEEPFSDLVENLLVKYGLSSVTAQIRLRRRWKEVVGPLLAAKSSPSAFRNGLLTVSVRTHAWVQELQLRKPLLIERIDAVLGPGLVRDIRFAARASAGEETPEEDRPQGEERQEGPEPVIPGLDGVRDPEMRAILRSIARNAASRERARRR